MARSAFMSGDASFRPPLGVAPSVAMDGPILPRRGLSTGAIGHGTHGRRYRLLAPMERGGMGELFLTLVSEPGRPDRHVVIKRLLADLIDDPKYVEMFKSEAWLMRRLDHPNIVAVYDMPVIDRAQCLAMELVRGKSAQQILAQCETQQKRVPITVALSIMAGILRGLEHAHTFRLDDGTPLDLVHRDVSPGNVLVSFDGQVKLTDFGIAKSQMSVVSTTVGIVKGKARYLAPEQILGEAATPRSDIFSAAAVTCELLTGQPTFDCSSVPKTLYAIVNGQRANLAEQLQVRAPMLVQLLDRALAISPNERVQSAAELAAGFEAQIRILASQVPAVEVSPWLRDLFRDEVDPLAQFDLPSSPVQPEAPTEHGYQANTPIAEPEPHPVYEAHLEPLPRSQQMSGPHTEVLERPTTQATASAPAFRATVGGMDTEPPEPRVSAARARTIVEAELVDPVPTVEPVADTTQVVRRRTWPVQDPAAVNEALSMVAYLQDRQAQQRQAQQPKAAPRAGDQATLKLPAVPKVEAPLPDLRPARFGKPAFLVLGLLLGIAGTLLVQGALPREGHSEERTALGVAPPPEAPPLVPASAAIPSEPVAPEVPEVPQIPEPARPPPALAEPARLDVSYPKGARVWVDGVPQPGRVPLTNIELSPGPHELRVIKRRYRRRVTFDAQPGARLDMNKTLEGAPDDTSAAPQE